MILAASQPYLLPYWGYWAKMAQADVFDLAIFDQFTNDWYEHRVRIGTDHNNTWLTLPVNYHFGYKIYQVEIKKPWMDERWELIEKKHGRSPNWKSFGNMLYDVWFAGHDLMWQLELDLILMCREYLGITTPVCIGPSPVGKDSIDRLAYVIKAYKANQYIMGKGRGSGSGKSNYLEGKREKLTQLTGCALIEPIETPQEIKNYSTVSIISAIFDFSTEELAALATALKRNSNDTRTV